MFPVGRERDRRRFCAQPLDRVENRAGVCRVDRDRATFSADRQILAVGGKRDRSNHRAEIHRPLLAERSRVPDPHRLVAGAAAGGETPAIGTHRHGKDVTAVRPKARQALAALDALRFSSLLNTDRDLDKAAGFLLPAVARC